MKMKKKVLAAAVAATFGAMGNAHAVNLDSDGLGQVLIMPFYTVQGTNETLISVVNTTDNVKAVKVRFREAMNSRDVLDFNLYLSPHDVWVAKVMDAEDGGAKLFVPASEETCTVPMIPAEGQPFLPFDYAGVEGLREPADAGPYGIERTETGYVEIIEMGEMMLPIDEDGNLTAATDESGNLTDEGEILALAATHVNPVTGEVWGADCQALVDAWTVGVNKPSGVWITDLEENGTPGQTGMYPATGGLAGGAAVINVQDGVEYSEPTTVIDNFYADGVVDVEVQDASGNIIYEGTGVINHAQPGTELPSLTQAQAESNVFVSSSTSVVTDDWSGNARPLDFLLTDGTRATLVDATVDSVSAVLMAQKVINEYTVNPAVGATTDWVVTFPTKGFYQVSPTCEDSEGNEVDESGNAYMPGDEGVTCSGEAIDPFNALYDADPQEQACETYAPMYYDRNERFDIEPPVTGEEGPVFSPAVPGIPPELPTYVGLCYEANVVSFVNNDVDESVFDADVIRGTFALADGYAAGWASMDLSTYVSTASGSVDVSANTMTGSSNTYVGLPVIGFAATRLGNSNVGVGAAYANTIPHRYVRSISD